MVRRVRFAESVIDGRRHDAPNDRDGHSRQLPKTAEGAISSLGQEFGTAGEEKSRLTSARIAEQRAVDAMMLARAMQIDIRNRNMKAQGVVLENSKKFVCEEIENLTKQVVDKSHSAQSQESSQGNDLVSISMAWLSDVFKIDQTH